MIDVPLLEELRETRRRLAEQQGQDVRRYAAMLGDVAPALPGTYVAKPLLPPAPREESPPSPQSSPPQPAPSAA